MSAKRWIDTTQPQTLLIAVFLLYINAGFELLLGGGLFNPFWAGHRGRPGGRRLGHCQREEVGLRPRHALQLSCVLVIILIQPLR